MSCLSLRKPHTMNYMWLCGLICLSTSVGVCSDHADFVTVYRIDDVDSFATVEFHKMTNTLGFILRTKNYTLIDSVKGMDSFTFNPADPSCYKAGRWTLEPQDISGEDQFTILTDDIVLSGSTLPKVDNADLNYHQPCQNGGEYDFSLKICNCRYGFQGDLCEQVASRRNCAHNNGGCRVLCFDGSCQCPDGFRYNYTTGSCFGVSTRYVVHENISGHVEASFSKHLIIAPANHTIQALIINNCSRCRGIVYDFTLTRELRHTLNVYHSTKQSTESTGNLLLIHIQDDGYHHGSFNSLFEFSYALRRSLLTLSSESGELIINVHPTSPYLCLTVIYKSATNTSQLLIMSKQNDEFQVPRSYFKKIGSWNLDRFEMPLKTRDPLTLSVIVSETGTVIHTILECNKGSHDVIPVATVPLSSLPDVENYSVLNEDQELCQNGGIYDLVSGTCNCLPGFMGSNCEVGCGPNSYGNDCNARCSMFDKGCFGMIFCKKNTPCFCAPGYGGSLCRDQCSSGSYGASCQNTCGNCKSGTCDSYTGECQEGCLPGFYPPLCQSPYKYSAEVPNVSFRGFDSVSLTLNNSATKGRGIINRYQVQCREISSDSWLEYQPAIYSSEVVTANVSGLNPGVAYEARVIFYSEDGNSYQDDFKVPKVRFSTLCKLPESGEYNIAAENDSSKIFVSWKYDLTTENSCPIIGYEISLHKDWQRVLKNVSSEYNNEEFSGLLSGEKYTVEIQALTAFGRAPISQPLEVETLGGAPHHVLDLKVIPLDDTTLSVTWKEPTPTRENIMEYVVEYECAKYLGCSEYCDMPFCNSYCNFHNQIKTTQTSVDLVELHPFTQYIIKVAGKVENLGPYRFIYGATKETVPNVAPEASGNSVVACTNSSVTVEWLPPSDCTSLNGYMIGYHYEIESPDNKMILQSNTSGTSASFKNLNPQTNYLVRVFAMTSMGWNKSHGLDISVTTAASVPEAVQNFSVYKRARRMLGLRWAPPKETYGEIKSFTVSYQQENGSELTEDLLPDKCVPWPDFFCHSIKNLIPNKKYTITVGARNNHIDADGLLTTITSLTVEGAPEAPESLTVVDRTSMTVSLQWRPPFMFNGILRSFVINVEQVDAANSSDCCEYYPVREVPVKEEQQYYYFQVSDLKPASKYSVGVSSKTLTIGSSSNVTINTLPEKPLLEPPLYLDNGLVQLPMVSEHPGVDSSFLLLMLPSSPVPVPEIWDAQVMALLQEAVNGSFYIVRELQYEDIMEELEVAVGTGTEPHEGVLGLVQDPELSEGEYRVGLAVLLDYGGAKNVGFAASEPFSIGEE